MPRQPRLDIPHILHHVIARGIERRDIFVEDADRTYFVARLSALLTKSATKCFAWSLMSNHFHLLLMPTGVPLAQTMRSLLTGYAVYFNRKYKRNGHLFQNRYKSILCEEEPYFLELVRYIHLNPLRAGLVADFAELDHYAWGGHAALLGNGIMAGQAVDEVLERFGRNRTQAMRGYRQFVADGIAAGRRDELVGGGLKRSRHGREGDREATAFDERILGSGEFVDALTGAGRPGEPKLFRLSLAELLKRVAEVAEVDVKKLRKPGKERAAARGKALFCCLAVRDYGYSGRAAGAETGLGSAGVSIAIRRGESLMTGDPALRERIIGTRT